MCILCFVLFFGVWEFEMEMKIGSRIGLRIRMGVYFFLFFCCCHYSTNNGIVMIQRRMWHKRNIQKKALFSSLFDCLAHCHLWVMCVCVILTANSLIPALDFHVPLHSFIKWKWATTYLNEMKWVIAVESWKYFSEISLFCLCFEE